MNDRLAGAFVPPINDLLVSQNRLQSFRPIDQRCAAIGYAVLVELLKKPFGPFVVFRRARDSFALPIEHRAHAAQLFAHALDIAVGPFPGMDIARDRCLFRRQSKSIKAHWEQNVIAAHSHPARAGIGRRHGEPVTDMQIARWIRQHGQGIVLGTFPIHLGPIDLRRVPFLLPFYFYFMRLIIFAHDWFSISATW